MDESNRHSSAWRADKSLERRHQAARIKSWQIAISEKVLIHIIPINSRARNGIKSTIDPTQLTLQAYYDEDVIKELRSDKVMKSRFQELENNKKLSVNSNVLDPETKAKWNQTEGFREPITQQ